MHDMLKNDRTTAFIMQFRTDSPEIRTGLTYAENIETAAALAALFGYTVVKITPMPLNPSDWPEISKVG